MRTYIKAGCAKKVGLWDEFKFGYAAMYAAHAVLDGKITGKAGGVFRPGRWRKRTVGANKTVIFDTAARLHEGEPSTSSTSRRRRR